MIRLLLLIIISSANLLGQHDLCGIWVNENTFTGEYEDVIMIKEVCDNRIVGYSYDQDDHGGFCNYRLTGTIKDKGDKIILKGSCGFAYEKRNHVPTSVKLTLYKYKKFKGLTGKKWITGIGAFFPKSEKTFRKISIAEYNKNTSYRRLKFYINKLESCECVKSINDSINQEDRLTERENKLLKKLEVTESVIKIKLKDANKADGDKVSVYLNGELIVSEFEVTKKAKTIKLFLSPIITEHKLVFVADNLGDVPPNTADIEIKSGKNSYQLTLNCDMDKNNEIILINP